MILTTAEQASAAYAEIQRKVTELQDAIIAFEQHFETNAVGLQEWCDDMDEVMSDLAEEVYE